MLRQRIRRRAFSMTEMVVVVLILAALAGLVIPLVTTTTENARKDITHTTMRQLKDVIVNRYSADMRTVISVMDGYPQANPSATDGRKKNPQLYFLFVQPKNIVPSTYDRNAQRGWNGPYLMHNGPAYKIKRVDVNDGIDYLFTDDYGLNGDPTVADGWGNPIVIQRPVTGTVINSSNARLVSAGPNGVLDTPINTLFPTQDDRKDDIILYLRDFDPYPNP